MAKGTAKKASKRKDQDVRSKRAEGQSVRGEVSFLSFSIASDSVKISNSPKSHESADFTQRRKCDENCQSRHTRVWPETHAPLVERYVSCVLCSEKCITHFFRPLSNGFATSSWVNEETIRTKVTRRRSSEEILVGIKQYHFINKFSSFSKEIVLGRYWYVVIAKDTNTEEEVEVLGEFSTPDAGFVDQYRKKLQGVGAKRWAQSSRPIRGVDERV